MKPALTVVFSIIISLNCFAQNDTITNSFAPYYEINNPALHYRYDEALQIHDYSGNWDLDQDGKSDQVFFVGRGGAHLYFFLRVVLSSDNRKRELTFVQSDLPVLPKEEEMIKPGYCPDPHSSFFSVYNNGKTNALFVRLDESTVSVVTKDLKRYGVSTGELAISFVKGKMVVKDFKGCK